MAHGGGGRAMAESEAVQKERPTKQCGAVVFLLLLITHFINILGVNGLKYVSTSTI